MTNDQLIEALVWLIHGANLRRATEENPTCGWEDTIGVLTYYGVFHVSTNDQDLCDLAQAIDDKTLALIAAGKLPRKPG